MENLLNRSLGRYHLVRLLGEGGMGAVFRARDVTLQRDVALKVLHPQFARRSDFRERFLQEARAAARVNHPGIVQVHDFGEAHDHLYIVMELIPGANLRQMLEELRASRQWVVLPEAIQLVRQLCLTLDHAHRQGVLHRDIKPDNIMLKPDPSQGLPYQPVITDLGLAKLAQGGMMTEAGTSMGTPAYMSPEQATGRDTDVRSDVYSLGVLLYELAVGRLPFPIRTITEAIRYHVQEPPPPPRSLRPDLPASLERAILKALEKEPARRYSDAQAMAAALAELLPEASAVNTGPPAHPRGAISLMTRFQQNPTEVRGLPALAQAPPALAESAEDRLAFLAPDGTSRSVVLPRTGVTLGRGSDNDVVLDHAGVSRRHARIEFDGAVYRVIDLNSTNGSFLGSIRLLPGVAAVWQQNEALRLGDASLRLMRARRSLLAAAPTGKMTYEAGPASVAAGVSAPQARSAIHRVGLNLETAALSVEPGASTMARLTVLNQGPVVDHYQVTVAGIPDVWVRVPPTAVHLMPGQRQEMALMIQPPRIPQSRAGLYMVILRVTSRERPDQFAEVSLPLTVTPFHQLSLDLRPRRQGGTEAGAFQVRVGNESNIGLTVQLSAADPADGCTYALDPAQVSLSAGQARSAQLRVQPRTPLRFGTGISFGFAVTARPLEASGVSQQVQGEWTQTPPVFEMSLRPQRQSGATQGVFRLQILNHGSANLALRLEATDPEDACLYRFDPREPVVPPGQDLQVEVVVSAQASLNSTAARSYPFTVTARPADTPALTHQVQGEWVMVPAPPTVAPAQAVVVPSPPPAMVASKRRWGLGCFLLLLGSVLLQIIVYPALVIVDDYYRYQYWFGPELLSIAAGIAWLVGVGFTLTGAYRGWQNQAKVGAAPRSWTRQVLALIVANLGLGMSYLAGVFVGDIVSPALGSLGTIGACIVWVTGFGLTIRTARRIERGQTTK